MNTPRKNYDDLQSPYAKSLTQYPSQSEEFLPFDLGGPGTGNRGNRQTPQKNARYTSTPAKYDPYRGGGGGGRVGDSAHKNTPSGNYHQNRHQHQQQQQQHHRGRGNNNRFYGISGAGWQSASGGGGFDNTLADGEKNYQRQPHRYNTQRGGRGGGGGQQRFHNQNKDNTSGSYFHPSMLEDPWRELMQRHNAIRNSQINIQTPQEEPEQQDAPVQQDTNDSSAESAASEAEQDNDEL